MNHAVVNLKMKILSVTRLLLLFSVLSILTIAKPAPGKEIKQAPSLTDPVEVKKPSPILDQNKHVSISSKKFYLELNHENVEFLVIEVPIYNLEFVINAQVYQGKATNPKLKNEVLDNNRVFYVSKKVLMEKCEGAGDPCYIEVTLSKLAEQDLENTKVIAITSYKDTVITITNQLPVSLPYTLDYEFSLEHVVEPKDISNVEEKGLDIHVNNRFASVIISATLSGDRKSQNYVNSKDYLTGDIWTNIIHVPAKDLALYDNPKVKITISPPSTEKPTSKSTKLSNTDPEILNLRYTDMYWSVVEISSSTKILDDKKYYEDWVDAGEFKYYMVTKNQNQEGLTILTVLDGEADLYANKGSDIYPDINTFAYKSTSIKDDELTFPKTSKLDDEENYIIGVYGQIRSRFKLSWFVDSHIKIYPITTGDFVHKFVEKGAALILQYDLSLGIDKYVIGFTGDHSKVAAYGRFYDETSQGLIESLPEPENGDTVKLGQSFIAGTIARNSITKAATSTASQLLVRIQNDDISQMVSCWIYPKGDNSSVNLKNGDRIADYLLVNQTQSYTFSFDQEIIEEVLDIQLYQGNITIELTDQDSIDSDPDSLIFAFEASQHTLHKQIDLFKAKTRDAGDNGLFKRYLARLKAYGGPAHYALHSKIKGDIFHRARPGTENIIDFDATHSTEFYYQVGGEVKNLQIAFEMKHPQWMDSLFYIHILLFENIQKVLDNVEIFYISEANFGKQGYKDNHKIPVVIQKNSTSQEGQSQYAVIDIKLQRGYLVIRPKKENLKDLKSFRALFKIIVNDIHFISQNYRTNGIIEENKNQYYRMFVTPGSIVKMTSSLCRGNDVALEVRGIKSNTIYGKELLSVGKDSDLTNGSIVHTSTLSLELYGNEDEVEFEIKVSHKGNDSKPAVFALKTVQYTIDDKVTMQDFFFNNLKAKDTDTLLHPLFVNQSSTDIKYTFPRMIPAAQFYQRFPKAETLVYRYDVMISNERPAVFNQENVCEVAWFHDRESYYHNSYYENYGRSTGWTQPKDNVTVTGGYPKTSLPYYGVMQVKITVIQEESIDITSDASVIQKWCFIIDSRPGSGVLFWMAIIFLILAIAAVILSRCILTSDFLTRAQVSLKSFFQKPDRNPDIGGFAYQQPEEEATRGLELN